MKGEETPRAPPPSRQVVHMSITKPVIGPTLFTCQQLGPGTRLQQLHFTKTYEGPYFDE